MALIRCMVVLESATGIPADRATNTYHFETIGLSTSILDNIADLMRDLYAEEPDAPPLDTFFSDQLCGTQAYVLLYDLADPEPRSPVASYEFAIGPVSTPALPPEVALTVSFRGDYVSGEPNARRRGRIYLPWLQTGSSDDGRPSLTLLGDVASAFSEFKAAADASANVSWVVYSPTSDEAVPITLGWVDDSWDTQRRRGWRTTYREFWS